MSDDIFFEKEQSRKKKFQPNIQDDSFDQEASRRSTLLIEEEAPKRRNKSQMRSQSPSKNIPRQYYGGQKDDSDSDHSDSASSEALSEITNESVYFEAKVSYQKRAIFRKNLALQKRQKFTNICQTVTPVLALLVMLLLKYLLVDFMQYFADTAVYIPLPFMFNLDYRVLSNFYSVVNISTCDQWYIFNFEKDVPQSDIEFFGYNDGLPVEKPHSAGVLSSENVYSYNCYKIGKNTPYFDDFRTNPKYSNYSTMNQYIFEKMVDITKAQITYFYKDVFMPEIDALPDGSYLIREANEKKLNYNLVINDGKYWQYHRDNGITKIGIRDIEFTHQLFRTIEGQVNIMDIINQAYMRKLFNNVTVISGINYFPFKTNYIKEINKILCIACATILPISLSMCLPVFLYTIVLEKETRLTEFMKINGMRMKNYWFVNFLFFLMLFAIQVFFYFLFGYYIFQLEVFYQTSVLLHLISLLGWGLAQISLAIFLSVFTNKAETATIIGYAVSIWVMTIAAILNVTVLALPNHLDFIYYLMPAFPFARIYFYIAWECAYEACISHLNQVPAEMSVCIVALYISSIVYLLLSLYLYQVVPQTYGVAKPWNYLCKKNKQKSIHRNMDDIGDIYEDQERGEVPQYDFDVDLEDKDAKAERNTVQAASKEDFYKYPLIVKNLRQVFKGFGGRPEKVAIKNFCLKIKKGEMVGLLGPNGAGKTSLIQMLIGLNKPKQGNAWVAGYDIRNQLDIVQLQIGVCPQFDILWNDLSVEEHLYFYARLKGVSPQNEDQAVTTALQEVLLEKFRHFNVRQLSGGMKRRLSIAISLVSEPKIIYLDEPSTGLDPDNRRSLWNILAAQKGRRAIVLTTHSMEEADVLCSKIAIINDGILRCIGHQIRLKTIYGGGYHLFINCQKGEALYLVKKKQKNKLRKKKKEKLERLKNEFIEHPSLISEEQKMIEEVSATSSPSSIKEEDFDQEQIEQRIIDFIQMIAPTAIKIRIFNGNFVYQIPTEAFDAENLFVQMEQNRQRLKIADWGISQCSLEDVFTKICEAT